MDISWAIREICSGENGIENLFDRDKSYLKLINLSDNKKDAIVFSKMIYESTREIVIELIHNAYFYESYIEKIYSKLITEGMNEIEAIRATQIFLEAFGFPGYRNMDSSKVDTIITIKGDFKGTKVTV